MIKRLISENKTNRNPTIVFASILITFAFILAYGVLNVNGMNGAPQRNEIWSDIQEKQSGFGVDSIISGYVNELNGFLYFNSRVFWTANSGDSWEDISPPLPENSIVEDIQFLNSQIGFVLSTTLNSPEESNNQLFVTEDRGLNWSAVDLNLINPEIQSLSFERASIFFIDKNSGWIWLKYLSSSNFSRGILLHTVDQGVTWEVQSVPISERVYFSDPQTGWLAGGARGDELYQTIDAGNNWQRIVVAGLASYQKIRIKSPYIYADLHGYLPILAGNETPDQLLIYKTINGGDEWILSETLNVRPNGDDISLTYISGNGSEQNRIVFASGGELLIYDGNNVVRIDQPTQYPQNYKNIFMFSNLVGFAENEDANCSLSDSENLLCTKVYKLIRTVDGGNSWAEIAFPETNQTEIIESNSFLLSFSSNNGELAIQSNTQINIGQGFDKCEIPNLTELQNWMNNSPYRVVNLYIGGSSRACANSALTSTFVKSAYQQGWTFIPTWVGPQAPCTTFSTRFSIDPDTAYSQGIEEAKKAINQLYVLGFTYNDKSGSVIYYDMEGYQNNSACISAVESFMDGWTYQLHESGNTSGVYGSSYASHLLQIFSVPNPPDVIWPALWISGSAYDPDITVWSNPYIPDTLYSNHQRIRQYAGGHNETWGNQTLLIDSNVLDGVVAIPNMENTSLCPLDTVSDIYVCQPTLFPIYDNNTCSSLWYPIPGFNGLTGYLAENAVDITHLTNFGTWTPNIPQSGKYTIEAYIPAHSLFEKICSWGTATYRNDSSSAKYEIIDKYGVKNVVEINQLPLNNEWISLGEFEFSMGTQGSVTLTNVTGELQALTNVSLSAIRFLLLETSIDPWITSISPSSIIAGSDESALTVNGINFVNNSQVQLNGTYLSTTYVNPIKLTAQISAEDLVSVSEFSTTVVNPSGNSTPSNEVEFNVYTFSDVPPDHIFWKYIEGFYAEGITTGCSTNPLNYCPDNPVTRAAMAVFLLRAEHGASYIPPVQTGVFTDLPVAGKEWMQPWVEQFYAEGITTGCSGNPLMYCPESSVTRAAMAVFILRSIHGADYVPPAATHIFADLPVAGKEWMEPWVEQFYREGITTGCGIEPLRFCPEDPVKRQAMAVFLSRAFGIAQIP